MGISIPPARVRKILDKQGVNAVPQKEINVLKQELLAYQKDGCQPKAENYKTFKSEKYLATKKEYEKYEVLNKKLNTLENDKTLTPEKRAEEKTKVEDEIKHLRESDIFLDKLVKISKLSAKKVRFNELVCVALGILVQRMITDFINHSIQQVYNDKKKIVGVEHCEGLEKLEIYPLIHTLPAVTRLREYTTKLRDFNERIRRLKAVRSKAGDNVTVKENANSDIQREKKYNKPSMYPDEKPTGVYDEKNELFYYTNNVRKSLKNAHNSSVMSDSEKEFNDNVRLSNTYRKFLSELTVEFIKRLCPWFSTFLKMQKLKTINVETTFQVLNLMFEDVGGKFSPIKDQIEHKLNQYSNHTDKKAGTHPEKSTVDAVVDGVVSAEVKTADVSVSTPAPAQS